MKNDFKLGVIGGAGWLGSIIIDSVISSNILRAGNVGVSYRSQPRIKHAEIFMTNDSQHLADWADVLMISVRPQDWPALQVDAKGKLVISIMAGVTLENISERLNTKRVVRAMPNIAACVAQSYTPWVSLSTLSDDDRTAVSNIFNACGKSDEVVRQDDIDYLTALSGSGPAYAALLADAMSRHAITRGIKPEIAIRAAMQTLIGAGRLFEHDFKLPANIVQEFVDYKGIIAASLTVMKEEGFEKSVSDGLEAGFQKALAMKAKN